MRLRARPSLGRRRYRNRSLPCSFEDIGHSKSAREMLRKYQIGTLVEGKYGY